MNYRSLALAIAALSSAHITTAAAQSVYVAPGGVYIGGGPVYVIPAPSNGNGTYVEPTYGYGYGVPEPTPYVAPTVVAPGVGYGVAGPYGLNGNGYGYGYRNGPPPAYYNGDPVLTPMAGRASSRGRQWRYPTTATDAATAAVATVSGAAIETQPLLTYCRATPRDARVPGSFASFELAAASFPSPPYSLSRPTAEVNDPTEGVS